MPTERHRFIRLLFDEYIAMYAARDARLLTRLSDDFSGFSATGDTLIKGRSRWEEVLLQDFARHSGPIAVDVLDFHPQDLAPDLVVATALVSIHTQPLPPEGGATQDGVAPVAMSAPALRLVLVLRREAGEEWRLAHTSLSAAGASAVGGDATLQGLHARHRELQDALDARTQALKQSQARVAQLMHTDAITGLPNRRHAEAMLATAWASAQRASTPLAVVLLDVQGFKDFNARYGRLAGDTCLQALALAFSQLAAQDARGAVAVRWDGDLFMLLMPGTDEAGAQQLAQRAKAAVDALALPHEGAAHARVTVRVGVAATQPQRDQLAQELVRAADRALQNARQG